MHIYSTNQALMESMCLYLSHQLTVDPHHHSTITVDQALMESMAVDHPELLSPYLRHLERCLLWAETNVAEEMLPNVCDEETNRYCYLYNLI